MPWLRIDHKLRLFHGATIDLVIDSAGKFFFSSLVLWSDKV